MKQDIKVAFYFLRFINGLSRKYIPLVLITSFWSSLMPLANIIIPKLIIDELMGDQRTQRFILLTASFLISTAFISLIGRLLDVKLDSISVCLVDEIELYLCKHTMSIGFENLENSTILDLKEQALTAIHQQRVITKFLNNMKAIINAIILISNLIIIISTLSILILIAVMAIVILNVYIFQKSQESQFNYHKMLAPFNRRFSYYINLSKDFSIAKDIRLFGMSSFLLKKTYDYQQDSIRGVYSKLNKSIGLYKGFTSINIQIQMMIVYAYMIYKVIVKSINIGGFVMYISASICFSNTISTLITSVIELRQNCKYLDLILSYVNIPSNVNISKRRIVDIKNINIEFKNVYFKYPGSDHYTLENISININSGEKLSIVGHNGAGKTTFIKLLCRLYDPVKGEILINGTNVKEFDYYEYMNLLAVVFQDFKLFSFSIKDNIAFKNTGISNVSAIKEAVRKVGLKEKISSLPEGLDTIVYKIFDKNGIELSGGESQKLAIARAVYKDSPIVVLDEPTAALDPYAENLIYSNLYELTSDKTTIFISHRLSSCKFCDRIAVFDKGHIIELGTHDTLLQNGGKYAEMWNVQAKYYL